MKKYLALAVLIALGGMAVSCNQSPQKDKAEKHHDEKDKHHDSPCRRS